MKKPLELRKIANIMPQEKLKLSILKNLYTIHRFPPNHEIPKQIYESEFYSITKTKDELSILCDSSFILNSENSETGWSCMKILGTLDFSLTGILADISGVLAENDISIFAISTFDTDYILVKSQKLADGKEALFNSGYIFI